MRRLALLLALALLCLPTTARAASFSVSYTDWIVKGDNVRLTVELPAAEAKRTIGPDAPLTTEAIARYVAAHVAARSAGGDCPPLDQGFDIGKIDPLTVTADLYRFEIFFQCPSPASVVLENSLLFALSPTHIDFARIEKGGGVAEKIFVRDRQAIAVGAAPQSDGFWTYLPIGLDHVRHNWDHIYFLIGLMVVLASRRDLVLAIAGLALGYGLSVAIAFMGMVVPDMVAAEALSGVAILMLAIEAVVRETRKPGAVAVAAFVCVAAIALIPLWQHHWLIGATLLGSGLFVASYAFLCAREPHLGALRLAPTALFGLLDGLSFLPPLAVVRPGDGGLASMLAGFDFGAFATQGLAVAALFLAVKTFVLLRPRGPLSRSLGPFLRDAGAAALCGIGLFWLASDFWP